MFAVVLAGGYAKRLWPLTLDRPKALLPVAGKPVIDYVVEKLVPLNPLIGRIIVSTNLRFQSQFEEWLKIRASRLRRVELMPESSTEVVSGTLVDRLRVKTGLGYRLEFRPYGFLPRYEVKAKRFKDLRGKG
jgi:NDP-sugar pyrophosphorylase family protein